MITTQSFCPPYLQPRPAFKACSKPHSLIFSCMNFAHPSLIIAIVVSLSQHVFLLTNCLGNCQQFFIGKRFGKCG